MKYNVLYLVLLLSCPQYLKAQPDTIHMYFSTDTYVLTLGHQSELRDQLQAQNSRDINRIELLGYADLRGTESYNLRLSKSRANEVASFIKRIYVKESFPIEIYAGGEDLNSKDLSNARRVDIVLHKQPQASHVLGTYEVKAIPVGELTQGALVRIKNLNFKPGREVLLPASIPHLKDLEDLLLENPDIHIEIQGHVCCPDKLINYADGYNVDTKTYNLSLARAENIFEYLLRKGITEERLSFRGFGWSVPLIYPEESEEDRIQNRRVELLVTKS